VCGDISQALKHFKNAERISRDTRHIEIELFSKALVIYTSLDELGVDVARNELNNLIESYGGGRVGTALICARVLYAYIELTAGEKSDALRALDAAVELMERQGGFGWWRGTWHSAVNQGEATEKAFKSATEIFAEGKHLEYIGYIYEAAGYASLPYLNELVKSENPEVKQEAKELLETISREAAEPLRINMLGPFKILKGEGEIANESWKSKKALSVLKYLATQREGSLVPKEVLMELMWPESPPASAAKNLNMALSSLRKTLEPQAGRGQSSYLVTSGDSLCLKTGKGGWVDFKLFRNKFSETRDAKVLGDYDIYLDCLRAAEELYRGDFLEEDLYEDWCRGERERLKEEHLRLLCDTCSEHLRRGNTEEALIYSEKAIEIDPGREGLYRSRMEIYSKIGDRAGIERTYDKCCRYLEDNFDVSPSPETEELYHSLRGK
jgi:DNA-binding SARP family transcriptional activator